jgi:hypothetical protein
MFDLGDERDRTTAIKVATMGESKWIVDEVRKRCNDWENVPEEQRRFIDTNEFLSQVIRESGGRGYEERLEAFLETPFGSRIEDLMKEPEDGNDR